MNLDLYEKLRSVPSEAQKPIIAGKYYYFDCMNAFITGRLWATTAFKDKSEAINTAANYEAELV